MKLTIGDKVKFLGCTKEQINWGNNDDPNDILVVGEVYEIVQVDIHSQHTKISLKGFSGRYNSVCFGSP